LCRAYSALRFRAKVKNEIVRRLGRGLLPAESVFDLLRRAAIFFGEARGEFAGVETGGDSSSGDSRSGKYRLAKSEERIDFDGLGLGGARADDEWEELETLGVD